jgi:alkylated DNA repair protein (DNA oxidative demethylase)
MTPAHELKPRQYDLEVRGVRLWRVLLDRWKQERIVADIDRVVAAAPFVRPITPWGKPMSVEMTSAGRFGWITDRSGYRYEPQQADGRDWPPIPDSVLEVWRAVSDDDRMPDCCLINRYGPKSRMGLHQDRDERDFSHPVVSISLGDDALFRIGGTRRSDPTESIWLTSGDVVALAGAARLAYHGIDRLRAASSDLLPDEGRINLTLRVVEAA